MTLLNFMNNILIITDDAYDMCVTEFAYQFALQNNADLIVAKTKNSPEGHFNQELVESYNSPLNGDTMYRQNLDRSTHITHDHYQPRVKIIDIGGVTETELSAYIQKENCLMVISKPDVEGVNLQSILNQISCPLMLLPDSFTTTKLNRIVYLTDLRYCQLSIVSTLSKLQGDSLLVAHLCERGLPDMTHSFAKELFKDIAVYANNAELYFSHVKEKKIGKVLDILVNTLRSDMLACIHRRFHFKQLFGDYLPKRMPYGITTPVLVFPY